MPRARLMPVLETRLGNFQPGANTAQSARSRSAREAPSQNCGLSPGLSYVRVEAPCRFFHYSKFAGIWVLAGGRFSGTNTLSECLQCSNCITSV